MILDPLSELFHSSTCLQVLSGHAAFSVTSALMEDNPSIKLMTRVMLQGGMYAHQVDLSPVIYAET